MCWLCEKTDGWTHFLTFGPHKYQGGTYRGNRIGKSDYMMSDNTPFRYWILGGIYAWYFKWFRSDEWDKLKWVF